MHVAICNVLIAVEVPILLAEHFEVQNSTAESREVCDRPATVRAAEVLQDALTDYEIELAPPLIVDDRALGETECLADMMAYFDSDIPCFWEGSAERSAP